MKMLLIRFSLFYFLSGFIEIIAECFSYAPLITFLKPSLPIILIAGYYIISIQKNVLFYLTMLFSFLTNLFFLPSSNLLLYAIITFGIHRTILIIYTIKILKTQDFIPIVIGFIPFFCMFSYIFKFADPVSETIYYLIVIQNFLISILGGIALSNYIMKDDTKNSWLYMSGLLFVLLQFVIFVERYYFMISIFRPIAMFLNICAFYCFFRFVISSENSYRNSTT